MIHFLIQAGTLTGTKNLISGLLLTAATCLANPETPAKIRSFDTSVYVTRQNKVRLSILKTAPGQVSIQLLDHKKHVLSSTIVGKKDLKAAILFNMSELGDGIYTLDIKSDTDSVQRQFTVATPQLERVIEIR